MQFHKNSPKRYYEPNRSVFITTNTYKRYPYFEEDIFCELFIEELNFCHKLKNFQIEAYKINPEHIHLLITPGERYNYSEIMGSLKRNFSRDYNDLINGNGFIRSIGGDSNRRLWNGREFEEHINRLNIIKEQFMTKYGINHSFPVFKWQKSFHYHLIKNEKDMINHIVYIQNQSLKHELDGDRYIFIDKKWMET